MGVWEHTLLGFGGLLLLMAAGLPIAVAMLIAGSAGTIAVVGLNPALSMLGSMPVNTTMRYELSIVPMFILMGTFVNRAGLARELYTACHAFVGHLRGGLAMATVMACGGFSAVCGSSLATAATMAKVSMPSMRRYRYHDSLASGAVAAGGTLGILIPPSVILVLYGIMTGTDIGQLFIAGIVPGLLAIGLYIVAIAVVTRIRPQLGPRAEHTPWPQRWRSLLQVAAIGLLFLLIIGGIYLGIFTPTEAAGIGAFGAFMIALWRRTLSWQAFLDCVTETARVTATLFIVLIGALVFANFINLAGLPGVLQELIFAAGATPLAVIITMTLLYLLLGCFLESLSMVLLTVPVFFPVASSLGIEPIWFGIFVVTVTELSLITPPVGLNLFVIKGAVDNLAIKTIYGGILPFVIADAVRLGILIMFPALVLILL